jgi:hypothetical protein
MANHPTRQVTRRRRKTFSFVPPSTKSIFFFLGKVFPYNFPSFFTKQYYFLVCYCSWVLIYEFFLISYYYFWRIFSFWETAILALCPSVWYLIYDDFSDGGPILYVYGSTDSWPKCVFPIHWIFFHTSHLFYIVMCSENQALFDSEMLLWAIAVHIPNQDLKHPYTKRSPPKSLRESSLECEIEQKAQGKFWGKLFVVWLGSRRSGVKIGLSNITGVLMVRFWGSQKVGNSGKSGILGQVFRRIHAKRGQSRQKELGGPLGYLRIFR